MIIELMIPATAVKVVPHGAFFEALRVNTENLSEASREELAQAFGRATEDLKSELLPAPTEYR